MKWEYTTVEMETTSFWQGVEFDAEKINQAMDELGAANWELVSAVTLNEGAGYSKSVVLFFKRPLGE